MKVAITGGFGFLGWHVACRLRAMHGIEPVRLDRTDLADEDCLRRHLADADCILHLAGVNRAASDDELEGGNLALADLVATAIKTLDRPIDVVFANSVQARLENPYGRGKRLAASRVASAVAEVDATFTDVLLPNLFGEHGRPGYNSFVATFAHEVSQGRTPTVTGDREIPLLHVQDAAAVIIDCALNRRGGQVEPTGVSRGISSVLSQLQEFHVLYSRGEVPDLSTKFAVDLFNTYRSYNILEKFPFSPAVHNDDRGSLFETVRAHGGTGQAFVSTTGPGKVRGNHYHLHKVERFFVVKGEAEIKLRRLLHNEILRYRLSGGQPSFVDMPTMWVHNITNVGKDELVTMFWADQLLDPHNPDQYPETVEIEETS